MRARIAKCVAVFITLAALAALPGFAQQVQTSPGVARISLVKGDVSMMRDDSGEWVGTTVNTPLVPGDTIVTGAGSRAEVQLDYSNVLRLDQNAQVKIADLTGSRIQLQVARGTADLAVFQGNQTNSEVDTPNVAVQPLKPGTYRIDVNSNNLSLVTVRNGQAQVSTPQGSTDVEAGKQITVEGAQNPQYRIANAQPLDAWDQWNNERNRTIESASNYDHVNRYYTGAQDLGANGRWQYVPGYDWCWTPYVDAGWVPYSYGRWVWEPFYGWTWVSYEPWGWAPYHYGRWFFYGSSWFWWPGAVTPFYHPLWAPAYVSFIGFGYGYHHFSFGFGYGFNSIGWFPLGPHDHFHRWWGHGRDHSFNMVNINNYYGRGGGFGRDGRGFHGSNMGELMNNAHVRRSIITMPADRFGREAVLRNRQPVSAGMLRKASFVRGTLPVVPTRASLTASNRAPVVPMAANRNVNSVRFFSRRSMGSPNPNHSFNSQAASIRQMVQNRDRRAVGGRPGSPNARVGRSLEASTTNANRGNVRVFANGRAQNSGRVVRAFGNSSHSEARSGQPAVRSNQQGWRRFGAASVQAEGNARGGQQRSFRASANPQSKRNGAASSASWRRFSNHGSPGQSPTRATGQNRAPVVRAAPQSRRYSAPRGASSSRSNQPGWRRFSGNAPASSRQDPRGASQRFGPRAAPSGQGYQNRGGFRNSTPQSQSAPRNQGRAGWNRFTPRSEAPSQNRGGGFYNGSAGGRGNYAPRFERRQNYGSRNYSRPPLRLNKPIVTERRSRSYSAPRGNSGNRGGFRGSAPHSSRGSGGGHRR